MQEGRGCCWPQSGYEPRLLDTVLLASQPSSQAELKMPAFRWPYPQTLSGLQLLKQKWRFFQEWSAQLGTFEWHMQSMRIRCSWTHEGAFRGKCVRMRPGKGYPGRQYFPRGRSQVCVIWHSCTYLHWLIRSSWVPRHNQPSLRTHQLRHERGKKRGSMSFPCYITFRIHLLTSVQRRSSQFHWCWLLSWGRCF